MTTRAELEQENDELVSAILQARSVLDRAVNMKNADEVDEDAEDSIDPDDSD
jgi:hypothetical protein